MKLYSALCFLFFICPFFLIPGHAQELDQILEHGINLSDSGRYEESRMILKELLKHNPDHAKALNCTGITFLQQGNADSAIYYFKKTLKADTCYYNANINLGRAYSLLQGYSQSLFYLNRYARIHPDSSYIWIEIARIYEYQGITDSVLYFLNLAIEKDQANYFAWAERARYFVNLTEYNHALSDINTADSLNPDDPYVLQIRGNVNENMGDYRNALPDYNKILVINPGDLESRMNRMVIYLVLEQYDSCKNDAEFILQKKPDDLTSIYCMAMCALILGDLEESIRQIQLGIELAPAFPGFYSLMGHVLTRQGNYAEALMFVNRALELKPEDIGSYFYKSEAIILSKTDPVVLKKNKYPPEFLSIRSSELRTLDKMTGSKKNSYYYPELKKKFSKDWHSLSLDEYFMLYYGHTSTDQFAPYARGERTVIDSMLSTMNRGLNIEAAKIGKDYLVGHPSEISIYYYTGLAFLKSSMYAEAEEFFYKYYGFIISLIAAGDGEAQESAFIVISTNDEYTLMDYLGYSVLGQKLTEYHNQFFDILTVMTTSGEEKEIYFNISKSFRALKKLLK